MRSLSLEQYFSALARSVDGPRAAADNPAPIVLRWIITDTGQECTTTLRNGVLVYVAGKDVVAGEPQATISLTRKTLDALAQSPLFRKNFDALLTANPPQITLADPAEQQAADKVFATLTVADPEFPIVTPRRD
ncbi:alkyl sulfatase C-terminal domain-containing protein [Streptomyces sp. NPDC053079]|uniref:alkyl sulfatase C-terminal domain-containing protein n=1 Tax=Streptomyces sp. NPDC053079 TaxID=3365697 RepID=UPI0037D3F68E